MEKQTGIPHHQIDIVKAALAQEGLIPPLISSVDNPNSAALREYLKELIKRREDEGIALPDLTVRDLERQFGVHVNTARMIAREEGFGRLRDPRRERPKHPELSTSEQLILVTEELAAIKRSAQEAAGESSGIPVALPSLKSLAKKYPDVPIHRILAIAAEVDLLTTPGQWPIRAEG